ncbi:MAG: hypothetical protein ABL888_11710 [Pirellulaceae bacterium]
MNQSSTHWPSHPQADKIRKSRRLYCWMTNSLAILVVITGLLSLSVREFRTVSQLEVGTYAGSAPETVERRVLDSIRAASSDKGLAETIKGVYATTGITPKVPIESIDFDKIRQKLRFAIAPGKNENSKSVLIEYTGSASRIERELVNQFTNRVRQEIDWSPLALPATGGPSANEMLAENRQATEQAMSAANKISAALSTVNPDLEAIQFGLLLPESLEKITRAELGWLELQIAQTYGGSSEEANLFRERFASQLTGASEKTTEASPFRLGSVEKNENGMTPRSLGEIRNVLSTLPVTRLTDELSRLERNLSVPMLDATQSPPPAPDARVFSLRRAMHEPIGLIANRGILVGSLLTAFCIGWVISLGINPRIFDPGFTEGNSLEDELHLPVVATLKPLGESKPIQQSLNEKFLRVSEFVLLLTVLLLVTLASTNSEIRQAILHNPLHAVTSVIWSFFN